MSKLEIDATTDRSLDGTENKGRLGANATLGVSLSSSKSGSSCT